MLGSLVANGEVMGVGAWETSVLLTLAVGFSAGFLLRRLGVPAGGMLGPFVAVAALSVTTGNAFLPAETRIIVQIVAGAFVGCSVDADDLRSMGNIAKPAAAMVAWYLAFTLGVGFLLFAVTPLSLPTALMSCVPGGISDVPVVAASMGADTTSVTVLQLPRLLMGIGLVPLVAKWLAGKESARGRKAAKRADIAQVAEECGTAGTVAPYRHFPGRGAPSGLVPEIGPEASAVDLPDPSLPGATRRQLFLKGAATLAVATAAGFTGQATGIPGMTFTVTIACVLAFNLKTGFAFVPKWLKRLCQYLAGTYLGTQVTAANVIALPELALPALIIVAAYGLSFVALGAIQHRLFHFTKTEGLLIATPAGASDMTLIMDDLGIFNSRVILIQVVRLITVLALFPQVINLILLATGTGV